MDPGAYIGSEPELAAETIPGGVRPDDDRCRRHAEPRYRRRPARRARPARRRAVGASRGGSVGRRRVPLTRHREIRDEASAVVRRHTLVPAGPRGRDGRVQLVARAAEPRPGAPGERHDPGHDAATARTPPRSAPARSPSPSASGASVSPRQPAPLVDERPVGGLGRRPARRRSTPAGGRPATQRPEPEPAQQDRARELVAHEPVDRRRARARTPPRNRKNRVSAGSVDREQAADHGCRPRGRRLPRRRPRRPRRRTPAARSGSAAATGSCGAAAATSAHHSSEFALPRVGPASRGRRSATTTATRNSSTPTPRSGTSRRSTAG